MEKKESKPLTHYVRLLHRYIGFFMMGIVLIYALAGVTLIFRDTNFLKVEKTVTMNLQPGIDPAGLAPALRMREIKIVKTEGDILYFEGGKYNNSTGEAQIKIKELVFPLNKFTNLHKTPSQNPFHWVTLVFGVSMLFLALSSFWMFSTKSKAFRSGIYIILAGFVFAILLLLLYK